MIDAREIPLSEITAGSNDRKVFDERELGELAASIAESGLAMPIKVRPCDSSPEIFSAEVTPLYEIVAGERRFRAHQLLGRETIAAIVEEMGDEHASAQMLIENLQRKDLNPVEEANAYRERMTRFGQSIEDIARVAGVKPQRVRDRLRLLDLAPDVLELARVGQLKVWFATQLARLDHNRQVVALRAYQRTPNMAWDDFAFMVERLVGEQEQQTMDLGDVLQIEEWVKHRPRGPRRFTRSELVESLAATVLVLETLSGEQMSDDEWGALVKGRAALAGEGKNLTTAEGATG